MKYTYFDLGRAEQFSRYIGFSYEYPSFKQRNYYLENITLIIFENVFTFKDTS